MLSDILLTDGTDKFAHNTKTKSEHKTDLWYYKSKNPLIILWG